MALPQGQGRGLSETFHNTGTYFRASVYLRCQSVSYQFDGQSF
jgi:hypothetical protein